jgi:CRP/FNR family transcriptional regulator, cyclic AMP receptor protein
LGGTVGESSPLTRSKRKVLKKPKTKRLLGTWRIDSNLIRQITDQASCGRKRRFRKDEMLYEQGTTSTKFYMVVSGLVQVSIVRIDGVEVVLEYMGPETILGEGAAFDGLPKFSSAVAVEETETIEFDTARMTEVFRQHPEFAAALLRVTSLKQRVLAVRLEHLASRKPEVRIMDLLHRLQEMFAIDYADGRLIVTHLTHEQISAMTGTSRVTVTRAMRALREQNQIDIIDGHILVKVSRPD